MRLGSIVLPAMVWAKGEDFAAVVFIGTAKAKAEGFGPNRPGPSGFRTAGGPLGRSPATAFATPSVRIASPPVKQKLTDPNLTLL